jgi:hypothetical protein
LHLRLAGVVAHQRGARQPPRGEVFWAFGISVVLVCVTVVVVYLVWSW